MFCVRIFPVNNLCGEQTFLLCNRVQLLLFWGLCWNRLIALPFFSMRKDDLRDVNTEQFTLVSQGTVVRHTTDVVYEFSTVNCFQTAKMYVC